MKKRNVSLSEIKKLLAILVATIIVVSVSFPGQAFDLNEMTASRITPVDSMEVLLERNEWSSGKGESIFFNASNVSSESIGVWRIEIPLDRPAQLVESWWHDDVDVFIRYGTTLVIRGTYELLPQWTYRGGCNIEYIDLPGMSFLTDPSSVFMPFPVSIYYEGEIIDCVRYDELPFSIDDPSISLKDIPVVSVNGVWLHPHFTEERSTKHDYEDVRLDRIFDVISSL